MRTATQWVTFVVVLLLTTLAHAAGDGGGAQNWWQVLVAELLKVVLVVFVPVLSTLTAVLLRRWKINVEYSQVANIADRAAGWAEHKALSALKEGRPKTPGGEKLQSALHFAHRLAREYKLPPRATRKLQDLIESSLGKTDAAAILPPPKV